MLKATGNDVAEQVKVTLAKADEDNDAKAKRIAAELDLESLIALTDVVPAEIETVVADSGSLALAQVGVSTSTELVNRVNERAVEYANDRAAEMVGKKWVDGVLVNNPDAIWRIDEATRDELQRVITQGLDENIGRDAIAELVREAGAFSEDRAEIIANTEIGHANSVGTLEGYKAARDIGIRVKKEWLVDEDPCPVCRLNADAGAIDLDEEFPSGDDSPLAHPGCECTLICELEEDNPASEEQE